MKERIVWLMIMVMCLVGTGQAMNILLCSEAEKPVSHGGPETGEHEDDSLVAWLESLGHTVNTDYMDRQYRDSNAGPPKSGTALLLACEAADLIFISRATHSGDVDGSGSEIAWNGVTTPLILNGNSYIIRGDGAGSGKRWGWASSNHNIADSSTTTWDLTAGGSTTMFDWSPNSASPAGAGLGVFQGNVASPGATIATFNGAGREVWVEFPAGTDFNAANSSGSGFGVAGAERVFFGHWGYDSDGNGPTGERGKWSDYITQEYKDTLEAVMTSLGPDPTINPAPDVDAGPDQSVYIGETVQLAGSATDVGSFDGTSNGYPEGVQSSYWYQESGPGTATFTPADTSLIMDPTVTFDVKGVYELVLQVSDIEPKDANDVVVITVKDHADEFIVGHWPLDGDADDASINSNHGTLEGAEWDSVNGMPTYSTDAAVGSYSIDLRDVIGLEAINSHDPNLKYVSLGAATELDFGTTDWTVSGWVKTTQIKIVDQVGKGTIFGNGGDMGGGHRYALIVNETNEGSAQLVIDADSNGGKFTIEDDGPDNDGFWHFIVGMREGGEIRIYRDGVLEGTNTGPPADFDLSGSSQHGSYIGVITDNGDPNFATHKHLDGQVDDVRVYNYALPLDDAIYMDILDLTAMGEIAADVDAGPNVTFELQRPITADLAGTSVDNGIPGTLIYKWSTVSRPAIADSDAVFDDDSMLETGVEFPEFGTWVLQLTVEDVNLGVITDSSTVTLTLISPDCSDVIAAGLLLPGDIAGGGVAGDEPDCYIDLSDIAAIAAIYLSCNDPLNTSCEWPF